MPEYIALRQTHISHEGRIVEAGDRFTTEFPEGMKLADNLKLVKAQRPAATRINARGGKREDEDDLGGLDKIVLNKEPQQFVDDLADDPE